MQHHPVHISITSQLSRLSLHQVHFHFPNFAVNSRRWEGRKKERKTERKPKEEARKQQSKKVREGKYRIITRHVGRSNPCPKCSLLPALPPLFPTFPTFTPSILFLFVSLLCHNYIPLTILNSSEFSFVPLSTILAR